MLEFEEKYGKILGSQKLGEGTYGEVVKTTKGYAVKIEKIRTRSLPLSVLKEIVFSSACSHPNIIKYHAVDCQSEKVLLYMTQYTTDFNKIIKDKTQGPYREPGKFKFVAAQLVSAVAYLTSRNILHRDIKPSNILINPDHHIVLADLGISIEKECVKTLDDYQVYTIIYRPPEIFAREAYTDKADVWAMGCTLYEIFKGYYLFGREARDPTDIDYYVVRDQANKMGLPIQSSPYYDKIFDLYNKHMSLPYNYFPKTDLVPEWPELNRFLLRMLDPDPVNRESAAVLQDDRFLEIDSRYPSVVDVESKTCQDKVNDFVSIKDRPYTDSHTIEVKWMLRVMNDLNFPLHKSYLAIDLLFRFSNPGTLIAISILFLINSFCEIERYRPIKDFVFLVDGKFSEALIIEKTHEILKIINYDLIFTTLHDRLRAHKEYYLEEVIELAVKFGLFINAMPAFRQDPNLEEYCIQSALKILEIPSTQPLNMNPILSKMYHFYFDTDVMFVLDRYPKIYELIIEMPHEGNLIIGSSQM